MQKRNKAELNDLKKELVLCLLKSNWSVFDIISIVRVSRNEVYKIKKEREKEFQEMKNVISKIKN